MPVIRQIIIYGIWGPWVTLPQLIWRFILERASALVPALRGRAKTMPFKLASAATMLFLLALAGLALSALGRSELGGSMVELVMTWPERAIMPVLAERNICLAAVIPLPLMALRLMVLSFVFSLVILAPLHVGLILWGPTGSVGYPELVAGRKWIGVRTNAHEKARALGDEHGVVYLGQSLTLPHYRKEGLRFSTERRESHMWVVGGTGAGKTRSVLEPLIRGDILAGRPVVIIDGKADADTIDRIWSYAVEAGREEDLRYFHLSDAQRSDTYNPFLHGSATEIKDKLISSFEQQPGPADYYRNEAQHLLLDVLNGLRDAGQPVMMHDLYATAGDVEALKALYGMVKSTEIKEELARHIREWKREVYSGLHTHLGLMVKSEFGHLLKTYNPDIDLLETYTEGRIVYFGLPTLTYQETAKALARLLLQDLKAVAGIVQTKLRERERRFMSVVVDEFAAFAFDDFTEFLNKARASKIGLVLSHQSLGGDLRKTGDAFFRQVVTNTNIKIALRQDDPDDSLYFARIAGTFKEMKQTLQTEPEVFGMEVVKGRSYREEEGYLLPPQLIQTLKRGHGAVVMKHPSYLVDVIELDHPSPRRLLQFERPTRTYSAPGTSQGPCLSERAAARKSAQKRGTTMPSEGDPEDDRPSPRRVKRRPKKESEE